jgi:hypothetical protein
MKKIYSKPDIYFEDFSLSTNIAAGCELQPINAEDTQCAVVYGRYHLLADDTHCTRAIEDGKNEFNNLCYHVPYESFNVFNS